MTDAAAGAAGVGGPDPWEDHARWWQDEFTDGVDPEYVDQILPWIAGRLPAGVRVVVSPVTGLRVGRAAVIAPMASK